jgi:dienelactone hydrolase
MDRAGPRAEGESEKRREGRDGPARRASRRIVVGAAIALLVGPAAAGAAQAQQRTEVRVPTVGSALTPGTTVPATVPGTLQLPDGEARVPAVLIVHGSGGVDGRGAFHAQALNAAGIATLEIDMWTPRGVTGLQNRPRNVMDTMPDVWGGWRLLGAHPRIDPSRIGVMGFSWGGVATMLSAFGLRPADASATLGEARFAAHVALYPLCELYLPGGRGRSLVESGAPTGAPVLVYNGDQDDYDVDPNDCLKLPAAFSTMPIRVVMVPGATHGFDGRGSAPFFDRSAKAGKGAQIRMVADPAAAASVRAGAVAFFRTSFGMPD